MSAKCYWIAPFPRNEVFLCENFGGNKSTTTYPEFTIAKKSVIHSKQLKKYTRIFVHGHCLFRDAKTVSFEDKYLMDLKESYPPPCIAREES